MTRESPKGRQSRSSEGGGGKPGRGRQALPSRSWPRSQLRPRPSSAAQTTHAASSWRLLQGPGRPKDSCSGVGWGWGSGQGLGWEKGGWGVDGEATGEPGPRGGGGGSTSSRTVCKMKLALKASFRVQTGEGPGDLGTSVHKQRAGPQWKARQVGGVLEQTQPALILQGRKQAQREVIGLWTSGPVLLLRVQAGLSAHTPDTPPESGSSAGRFFSSHWATGPGQSRAPDPYRSVRFEASA